MIEKKFIFYFFAFLVKFYIKQTWLNLIIFTIIVLDFFSLMNNLFINEKQFKKENKTVSLHK